MRPNPTVEQIRKELHSMRFITPSHTGWDSIRRQIPEMVREATKTVLEKGKTRSGEYLPQLGIDLLNGKFWHVLGSIDGYPRTHREETEEKRQERRKDAVKHFNSYELSKVVEAAVNIAIYRPNTVNALGAVHSHATLYEQLWQSNSLITKALPKEGDKFREYLHNMRFWETIGVTGSSLARDIEPRTARDVLENHSHTLKSEYVPLGANFLNIAINNPTGFQLDSMCRLQGKGLLSLMNIVQRLEADIPKDIRENLLKGYINATLAWSEHDVPLFEAGYDAYKGDYRELLGNAYMQSQVAINPSLQKHVGQTLQHNLDTLSDYGYYMEEVIEMMPMNHKIKEYLCEPVKQ